MKGDRYVKLDDKKTGYIDAISLNGHSMSQMLPYDVIEIWYGHPEFIWINKKKI